MKKIKSILNIKLLLTTTLIGLSVFGFSQTNGKNSDIEENSKEIRFDFLGSDLKIQSPPQLYDRNNLSGGRQSPLLKSASFNHSRLDSMLDLTNYGDYAEHSKWYFYYDASNILATSERRFLDASNEYRDKKETRKYNKDGQVTNILRTEYSFNFTNPPTTYSEDNQYANGNLIYQFKIEAYFNNISSSIGSVRTTTQYSYNEKNQLVKVVVESSFYGGSSTTEYYYDQEGHQKYIIFYKKTQSTTPSFQVTKYDYLFSDTTMLINQKDIFTKTKPLTLSDLEKINNWKELGTFTLNLDQYGRTKSIEEKSTVKNPANQKFVYGPMVEYNYTANGKQKLATFYLPKDYYDPETYYISTIIKHTYDEQDNLVQYEKMFYNSVLNEMVDEELQTYYYSSVKSALTSNNQQKTDNFHIYPNPASDVIYLSASPAPGSNYIIYNLIGEIVNQGMLKSQSIQVSQLKPGIYFMKIARNNLASSFRFVKK